MAHRVLSQSQSLSREDPEGTTIRSTKSQQQSDCLEIPSAYAPNDVIPDQEYREPITQLENNIANGILYPQQPNNTLLPANPDMISHNILMPHSLACRCPWRI